MLISYGADVNQGLNEEYGRNPLLGAAIGNYSKFVKLLVDSGAKTGIHLAALQGDIDLVTTFWSNKNSQLTRIVTRECTQSV